MRAGARFIILVDLKKWFPKWKTSKKRGKIKMIYTYKSKTETSTEALEQTWLFNWAKSKSFNIPELKLLYHIPNEGKRTITAGSKLKQQGLKAGVPDICLPVAKQGYHGLYIELKTKSNRATTEQLQWLEELSQQGYYAAICYGWQRAADVIENYLGGKI